MKEIKSVAIIGLGALGIMYGKYLNDRLGKEAVRIVADKDRIASYKEKGIFCNGERCDFQFIDSKESCDPADLLIFAVKFNGLEAAIQSAKNQVGEQTIIISLLNGIKSEEILAEAFGSKKVLYCVAQGMDARKQENQVTYVNIGLLSFGEADNGISEKIKRLSAFFDCVHIPYEIPANMMHKMWSKLMLNTGVNTTAAVFEANYGILQQQGEPREMVIAAMKEVIAVAKKEGIELEENEINYWMQIIDSLDPDGMPSMRQDTASKRKTEIDLFSGAIVSLGEQYGIQTPINRFLYKRVKEIEKEF